MTRVTLYTRAGCCLCDEAKQVVSDARRQTSFEYEEIDIDRHPQWREQYSDEVPVIAIDGRKAFKYRVNKADFLRRLAARA